jgi:hypothetical protein
MGYDPDDPKTKRRNAAMLQQRIAGQQGEYDRVRAKYGAATPSGGYVNPQSPSNSDSALWAWKQNAEDPNQSNLERNAERRQNYFYGGSADYAGQQQAALGAAQQASGQRFGAIGAQAGAGMAAAQGRAPGEFLDRGALGANAMASGRQTDVYGGLMKAAANQQGPSAAQAQLNMATSAAAGDQLRLARSGRGMGESAAGLQQAASNVAQIQGNAANQSAMLRAQEDAQAKARQLQAYGAAGGVVAQQRDQDLATGAYTSGVKQAGQSLADQTALGYGNLGLGAAGGQASADLGYFGGQAQVAGGVSGANQGYEQNLADRFMNKRSSDAAAKGKDDNTGAYLAAAGAGLAALSDIRAKKDIAPASASSAWDMRAAHGGEGSNPDRVPVPRDWEPSLVGKSREQIEAIKADLRKLPVSGLPAGDAQFSPQMIGKSRDQIAGMRASLEPQQQWSADIGKAKIDPDQWSTDIGEAQIDEPASAALAAAPASKFKYKDPAAVGAENKEYTGPMAQDLAKTPAGRSAVVERPDGMLGVDTGRLSLLNAAAFGEQKKEIERLKAEISAKKKKGS